MTKTIEVILIILFACAFAALVWRQNIKELQLEQQKEVTDVIRTTIEHVSQKGNLLPELVFINVDSTEKQGLRDSLMSQITTVLTNKYIDEGNLVVDDLSLKPFFVLPNSPDSSGNYILTDNQINELKSHIYYLTKQVETEVDRAKIEVGRDIDRLNIWVSIWIGVIGFLGIFIPIILNIDISRRASEAKEEANKAKSDSEKAQKKSTEAFKKITDAQPQIDKIDNLEEEVKDAVYKSSEAITKAEIAKTDTVQVKRNLSVILAINKLKDFNPQTLVQLDRENVLPFYIGMLESILKELKVSSEHYNSDLTKNWLGQIAIYNQNISLYRFINPEQTKLLNEFAELISNALDNYDRHKFDQIVNGLEGLIVNLKKE